jgi:hypothetical protein
MQLSKAVLFAVLRTHHADDQPGLAQRLPDRFDTDDFPGLLDGLGLTEDELAGSAATKAVELSSLAGDPHGRDHPDWATGWPEQRRPELRAELTERRSDESGDATTNPGSS